MSDNYEAVSYIDPRLMDMARNAPAPVVIDHRTGVRLPSRQTTMIHPMATGQISQQPLGYSPWSGWWPNPGYINPPIPPANTLTSILGGFSDLGSLANIVAQAFAAFLPLPAAPTTQDSTEGDPAMNASVNSSNLIKYQSALATFARRDQQILTLGAVIKELFKRPGMA